MAHQQAAAGAGSAVLAPGKKVIFDAKLVKFDEVVLEVLIASLRNCSMVPPTSSGVSKDKGIEMLVAHFKKRGEEGTEQFICNVCAGPSDVALSACPYCGATDDDQVGNSAAAAAALGSTTALAGGLPVDVSDVPLTEERLREGIERVRGLKRRLGGEYWDLGMEAAKLHDSSLWKLGKDEQGRHYTSWSNFCKAEFRLSHGHVFMAMNIARAYKREDADRYERTKLGLVLQIDPSLQTQAYKLLDEGISKRKLREMARGKSTPTGRQQIANRPSGQPAREEKVTVASLIGSTTILLFRPPMKGKASGKSKVPVRARTLEDRPVGRERMENGVIVRYAVALGADGFLELVVERSRDVRPSDRLADFDAAAKPPKKKQRK